MIPMKKLFNKKGFTLMEMLIVVAIIVILVAVSIPTFTSSLGSAKKAADDANLRAAKGLATTQFLAGDKTAGTYYYDAVEGKLEGATADCGDAYGQEDGHSYVKIVIAADGSVTATWQ